MAGRARTRLELARAALERAEDLINKAGSVSMGIAQTQLDELRRRVKELREAGARVAAEQQLIGDVLGEAGLRRDDTAGVLGRKLRRLAGWTS